MKNNRNSLLIASAVSLVLGIFIWGKALAVWSDKLTDLLFTAKPTRSDIIIVAIDDPSIQAIGQWPWPRAVFGRAVVNLDSARVIGIDINFKESSGRGVVDDDYFSRSLEVSGTTVVLSSEINPDNDLIMPLEKFVVRSTQGFTNVMVASDGVARRLNLRRFNLRRKDVPLRINEDFSYPSFDFRVAQSFGLDTNDRFASLPDTVRVNYRGPDKTFTVVSFRDVLENKIPADFFRNKIILIGATAPDLHDYHQTPFGLMSGVELQANAVQTIVDGAIFRSSRAVDALAVILLAFVSTVVAFRFKSFTKLLLAEIGILIGYNLAVFLSFDRFFIIDLLYPNLAIVGSAVVSVAFQYIVTHKEKKFIHDTFSRYLAPQVISQLMEDPSRLKLGGERREVTILFSDIRSFTSISEKMPPDHLAKFMNRYLTAMSDVVFKHEGVIDKYIGDAVMAFWGAPLDDKKHALHAVSAALDMMVALAEFNRESQTLGEPVIDIGIGLNSGEVTVGNMGSEKRFDYTVLGDNVNLASRLEGLNKNYGTNIIASQATVGMLNEEEIKKHAIVLRELGEAQVKGKEVATKIYEIKHSQFNKP